MRTAILALAIAVTLFGCGGSRSSSVSGPSVNLTGNYQANIRSNRFGFVSGSASIRQDGLSLSGSYRNSVGSTYRITGNVSGSNAQITLTGTNNPQVCNAEISISADGNEGNGTYSCNDGDGGQFTLRRV